MSEQHNLPGRTEPERGGHSTGKATLIGCAGGLLTLALVFLFILTICGRM